MASEELKERPSVAAPDGELARQVFDNPPETVPLGLVLPVAVRKLGDELRLHRRKRQAPGRHCREPTRSG